MEFINKLQLSAFTVMITDFETDPLFSIIRPWQFQVQLKEFPLKNILKNGTENYFLRDDHSEA